MWPEKPSWQPAWGWSSCFQFETDFPTWMGSRSVCPLCLTYFIQHNDLNVQSWCSLCRIFLPFKARKYSTRVSLLSHDHARLFASPWTAAFSFPALHCLPVSAQIHVR